jgi:type I restriction enzyme S subunit
MRHSGVEWIGEIPYGWNIISFSKGIVRMSTGLNPRDNFELSKEKEYYYVTIKNFKDGKLYLDDNCDRINIEAWNIIQERSQLQKDDILFASISKDGQAYIIKETPNNWNINESVFCIRVNRHLFHTNYFYYHLIDDEYYKDLRLDATGTTFQSIKQNKLRKSFLCLPPLSEQQRISDYLNKVCGDIDNMVALQEIMIEELKAYKQSVIIETVTKGLNPNIPLRYSGIDWIGEIPVHWGTPAISYLASITSGSTPDRNNPLYWTEGTINWVKTGELQNKIISSTEERITEYALKNTAVKLYPQNTILIAMYGQGKTRGMTGLLNVPCTTNQACAALLPNNDAIDVFYLWKCMIGAYDSIRDKAVGTGQPNLNIELISKFIVPLPPYNEQLEIVEYIDEKVSEIDSLITVKQTKIEELKEYKKSIIYEYVTGKKEVPYGN